MGHVSKFYQFSAEGDHWRKDTKLNNLSWSKFSILTHLVRCAEVVLCTVQSATSTLRIRFRTLRQWCVKFLPRIFYPFWARHSRKLRIGLFDRRATKWYFGPACDHLFDRCATREGLKSPRLMAAYENSTKLLKNFEILNKMLKNLSKIIGKS